MSQEEMKMSIEEIKNAMLHPDLIKHVYDLKINDKWGNIEGRQLILDVHRLCEKYEILKKEIEDIKNE
ncbi:hypothetical protein [Bacillus pumilus]|uniref:hypothetical protein n=1 Tax=Bacillus pumilus TaxID=1408 RepID=UPI003305F3E8